MLKKEKNRTDDSSTSLFNRQKQLKLLKLQIMETEKTLKEKIQAKTLQIKEKYPELTECLSRLSLSIPNENNPEMNVKYLSKYYNSINNIL